MEQLTLLTEEQVRAVQQEFGTPIFVYDERTLQKQAADVLSFPHAYGFQARYSMKGCPTASVIRLFHDLGLHIDASSVYEAERAMRAGVPPEHIQITAQELPRNLGEWLDKGFRFNLTSLHQLREYGRLRPGTPVSVRINPGRGSGHNQRTNVGGRSASFGIWHEHLDQLFDVQRAFGLRITGMHTHIGSGADPQIWHRCARLSLRIASRLPEVETLNLGGGFKVARVFGESGADLKAIGELIKRDFEAFYAEHGRKLKLEIEPGTYLVANAAVLICTVIDVVDTGPQGYRFIKIDAGMTEITRPSLYGAQHPIVIVPSKHDQRGIGEYVVVGHCCESGDLLTPKPGNPERLSPRTLTEPRVGDALVIGGAGAYCSAMCVKNYNSFPEAPEVLLRRDGTLVLIRKRQTLDQILANEVSPWIGG